ncbi:MAG: exo-beta-N-acetylmuramidase NamZ domain-containing protein, partial [Candidatus Kapaibacteriota bacterium]
TIGEIAFMINEEGWLKSNGVTKRCDLTIVKMENWKRQMNWEDTNLEWFQTSPNIKSVDAIRGIAMFGVLGELGLFNLGVGTDLPFQVFSIRNVNVKKLEKLVSELKFDGVAFINKEKQKHLEKEHNSFLIKFAKNKECKYYTFGMTLLFEIRKAFPHLFSYERLKWRRIEMFKKVTGTSVLFDSLIQGDETEYFNYLNKGLDEFLKLRSKYLLYK